MKEKKAMVTTQSVSDNSLSEEDIDEKIANLCLMAKSDSDNSDTEVKVSNTLSYDELEEAFSLLYMDFNELHKKTHCTKKEI